MCTNAKHKIFIIFSMCFVGVEMRNKNFVIFKTHLHVYKHETNIYEKILQFKYQLRM